MDENNSAEIAPDEVVWIGRNEYDYTFGVCRFGEQWNGFARGELPPPEEAAIFFFPFNSTTDRQLAIKKTVAYAGHFESGYGSISQWTEQFAKDTEIQKAQSSDFICADCEQPFCDGNGECEDGFFIEM